jgi:hypothetical protein
MNTPANGAPFSGAILRHTSCMWLKKQLYEQLLCVEKVAESVPGTCVESLLCAVPSILPAPRDRYVTDAVGVSVCLVEQELKYNRGGW